MRKKRLCTGLGGQNTRIAVLNRKGVVGKTTTICWRVSICAKSMKPLSRKMSLWPRPLPSTATSMPMRPKAGGT